MWIDITQSMKTGMPNWPGDTAFSFELAYTKQQTGSVNIGKIVTSLHTGTHADAPFHFDNDAPSIEQLDVNTFIGDCVVIDCRGEQVITASFLQKFDFQRVQRVLLKTVDAISEKFPSNIPIIDADVAKLLHARGVVLLGVDNPSVDMLTSKQLAAHHALYKHHVHIVEGLDLSRIDPGLYELICLPLKIEGADGAPVRAVIRKK